MNRQPRIAALPKVLVDEIIRLRKMRFTCLGICDQLGIHKASEQNAVSEICRRPDLRRYQVGIECGPHSSPHRLRVGTWA